MSHPDNATNRETLKSEVASLLTHWKAETVDSGLPTYVRLVIHEVREQVVRDLKPVLDAAYLRAQTEKVSADASRELVWLISAIHGAL